MNIIQYALSHCPTLFSWPRENNVSPEQSSSSQSSIAGHRRSEDLRVRQVFQHAISSSSAYPQLQFDVPTILTNDEMCALKLINNLYGELTLSQIPDYKDSMFKYSRRPVIWNNGSPDFFWDVTRLKRDEKAHIVAGMGNYNYNYY